MLYMLRGMYKKTMCKIAPNYSIEVSKFKTKVIIVLPEV